MTSRKSGYFVCKELEDDVYIPFINLNTGEVNGYQKTGKSADL